MNISDIVLTAYQKELLYGLTQHYQRTKAVWATEETLWNLLRLYNHYNTTEMLDALSWLEYNGLIQMETGADALPMGLIAVSVTSLGRNFFILEKAHYSKLRKEERIKNRNRTFTYIGYIITTLLAILGLILK